MTEHPPPKEDRFPTYPSTIQDFADILTNAPIGIFTSTPEGRFLAANNALAKMYGYDSPQSLIDSITDIAVQTYADPADRKRFISLLAEHGKVVNDECRLLRKDGSEFWISRNARAIRDANGTIILYQGFTTDITDRKTAERERDALQAQLLQSQKMESIGRLAGGVAHDFNNMLGVILGHIELAMDDLSVSHPLQANLAEIRKAADRSARLTRQLLAFARKQTVNPRVIDLNEIVAGMLQMLRRLIGEDIDLVWQPSAAPQPVRIDPTQIDQILANLCVNARDAIGDVGIITIRTKRVSSQDISGSDTNEIIADSYVVLSVSDSGCGMTPDVQNNLFEPFFTTKETGKGTGLGLATVYGIVKQNRGIITVDSTLGGGTTMEIFLPLHASATSHDVPAPDPNGGEHRGQETILLVEDEQMILDMTASMLNRQGYQVLKASSPEEALRIAREHHGPIDLLITDVVMPGMNGRELARHILGLHPMLICLFMSGYTADIIADRDILDRGVHFIQKPFVRQTLAAKVRELLDYHDD